MKPILALVALVALAGLAACGVDGEPVAPSMNASIGAGPGGLSAVAGVTLKKDPVSAGWGVGT